MPQQGSLIVRPFEWHDLLTVYRYRHQVLCLDQTGQLINGSPIGLGALLRQLKLTDYGDYTGVVVPENRKPLMGQMNADKCYLPAVSAFTRYMPAVSSSVAANAHRRLVSPSSVMALMFSAWSMRSAKRIFVLYTSSCALALKLTPLSVALV